MTDTAIACRTGHPDEVIAAYADRFYDARPRLEAPDHIVCAVLGPGLFDHNGIDPALAIKHLAYFGGPILADALVAAPESPSADLGDSPALDPVLACRLRLLLATRTAPQDARTTLTLFQLYARMQKLEQREAAEILSAVTGPLSWSSDALAAALACGSAASPVPLSEDPAPSAPALRALAQPDPDLWLRASA
jgi:hypothetical protein